MWPALHQLFPSLVIPPTADGPELDPVLFTCSIQRKGENKAPSVEAKEEDPDLQAFYQVRIHPPLSKTLRFILSVCLSYKHIYTTHRRQLNLEIILQDHFKHV